VELEIEQALTLMNYFQVDHRPLWTDIKGIKKYRYNGIPNVTMWRVLRKRLHVSIHRSAP
jgi:hypothetical protein